MRSPLRSALDALASTFTNSVLAAIRGASLDDLQAESGGWSGNGRSGRGGRRAQTGGGVGQRDPLGARGKRAAKGRLARRSDEQIAKAVDQVVALVKKSKTGLRSEEIKKALGLDRREVPRILKTALAKRRLRAKGQKRATTYTAV
jgi:hypothetical protein